MEPAVKRSRGEAGVDGEARAQSDAEVPPPPPPPEGSEDRQRGQEGRQGSRHGADRVKGIPRPASLSKEKLEQHYLEGHANYDPGCEYCVRCRGLMDRHTRGESSEDSEIPTMSMDFCFLCQKDQGKSMPTLVMRSKPPGYTGAFVCPGKSTRNEAYSDKIVERATAFVDNLGYKRIGVKSD